MVCPRCNFRGEVWGGLCPHCGYDFKKEALAGPRSIQIQKHGYTSTLYTPARGDVLGQGRYRILDALALPEPQREQGKAWLALDANHERSQVVIREVVLPRTMLTQQQKPEQVISTLAQYHEEMGRYPGLPKVINLFSERGSHYLVFNHTEGTTLTAILAHEGGSLPERTVVAYGRQLCDILTVFAQQNPPFVHGAINLDTIIISDDGALSLILLPLFQPMSITAKTNGGTGSYFAPEQVRDHAVPSSDLYAVAAILHHAVTGYDPHEFMAFFHPPARRLNPKVTPTMEAILSRQMRLSIPQRYVNAAEMRKDLDTLAASYPEEEEVPFLFADPNDLKPAQLKARNHSMNLLNLGIFCSIIILLLIGVLFAVLRP